MKTSAPRRAGFRGRQGRGRRRALGVGALLAVACGLVSGCAPEERIVRYQPFMANLPGATTQMAPVGPRFENQPGVPTAVVNETDGFQGADFTNMAAIDSLRVERPDGSVRLVSKSVRQLMTHIEQTLDNGEDDLLLEQVISEQTKQHYRGQGRDPIEAVDELHAMRRDIAVMFSRMPFGAQSPTVLVTKPGPFQLKVRLTGQARKNSRLTEFWIAIERGDFRLIWFS